MRLRNILGAAFLIMGTVGVASVYGAYNDLDVDYRDDGMILLDDEPWYPRGVIFIPCPSAQLSSSAFKLKVGTDGRGFCYNEFAADGGNFLIFPCFHLNEPEPYNPDDFHWQDYMPCDVTDEYDAGTPTQCDLDLDAAAAAGIKIIGSPSLAYEWEQQVPFYPPYCRFMQYNNENTKEGLKGGVKGSGAERDTTSRTNYFNTVKQYVIDSGSEEAHLGWCSCWEAVGFKSATYLHQVHDDLGTLETASSANHPVYLEVNEVARWADLYRDTNTACDILGYNIRICPAPTLSALNGWYAYWLNNPWASITGDAADMHFWSVDGEKPVVCCVDAVWWEGYFPAEEQVRFMTYDAIIHRVNGLYWGMYHYVYPSGGNVPGDGYTNYVKPVIREMGHSLGDVGEEGVEELLTAPFDDLMVEAVVTEDEDIVERTAIIGGDLAPKNHYCSGRYLIEACAKYMEEEGPMGVTPYVYLIVACRDGRVTVKPGDPPSSYNEYEVTFRPYFSGTWGAATVEVVNESRSVSVVNGAFTDTIISEGVHIYKFEKPSKVTGS